MAELRIEQDALSDTVTINGIAYSRALFEDFGAAMPLGRVFRLVSRENNVLTIEYLPDGVKAHPLDGSKPVAVVAVEADYWSRGHFYEGRKHVLRPLGDIESLPVGTQLYAHPAGVTTVSAPGVDPRKPGTPQEVAAIMGTASTKES